MELTGCRRRVGALALVAGLVAPLASCAREQTPSAEGTLVSRELRRPIEMGRAGPPACPATGHWSQCAVLKRLEAAGVAPRPATSLPDLPTMGVTPALYTVGKSGLAVYLFADSATRSRAARTLDTLRYLSASRTLTMRGETTAIESDNLLALLFSRNEQQRERVSDALTAGAPQPEEK